MRTFSSAIILICSIVNLSFGQNCQFGLKTLDPLVTGIIDNYIKSTKIEKEGVVALDFRIQNDTIEYVIWSFVNLSYLKNYPPSFYLMFKDLPVLIYTGFETQTTFSNEYIACLDKACSQFLYNDVFKTKTKVDTLVQIATPIAYHPDYWKITLWKEAIIDVDKNFRGGRLF